MLDERHRSELGWGDGGGRLVGHALYAFSSPGVDAGGTGGVGGVAGGGLGTAGGPLRFTSFSSVDIASRISACNPPVTLRNSAMALPIDRAACGSRLGPSTSSATIKTTRISGPPMFPTMSIYVAA